MVMTVIVIVIVIVMVMVVIARIGGMTDLDQDFGCSHPAFDQCRSHQGDDAVQQDQHQAESLGSG